MPAMPMQRLYRLDRNIIETGSELVAVAALVEVGARAGSHELRTQRILVVPAVARRAARL
jgi:hypothetical protein